MADDFLENLTSLTNNLEDIAFTRYATITNVYPDGTVDCKETETSVIHKNVRIPECMDFKVDDVIILGFVDNNIYDPFILSFDNIDLDMTYTELLDIIEKYEQLSDNNLYTMFRGDCWTINNNFESSAAITSESDTDFTVTGTFRTKCDMVGIYWNSEDIIQHPYISYGNRADYSNVTLEFDYEMTGCTDFSNSSVSITLNGNGGEIYYLTMNRFIEDGHVTIPFNQLTLLPGDQYRNAKGEWVTVTEEMSVDVVNLKNMMFVLIPSSYNPDSHYEIIENVDFSLEISNISVTNGFIKREHLPLNPHKYRLAEDYDDIYNLNPRRLAKEMHKLGYVGWCDLYVGASHYYEKSGTVGDTITDLGFNHNRTEKMVLDEDVPLNCAFAAWLDCYSRELKAHDTNNLIVSVSMENLQCPTSWRQKDCDGNYAVTAWIPSTFFYSPCKSDVITYMKSVSAACLDILVDNGMLPILQLGEAWWWWNVNDTPEQPPCFYDDATKAAYQTAFGESMPEYDTSWETDYDKDMMSWLNQKLVEYSEELRSVVKNPDDYTDGVYMALFFPPSVIDEDTVPDMIRQVNYLRDAYTPLKLDVFEIEDYDWVTGESIHHEEAYSIGAELGFNSSQLHYYGGFVLNAKDAHKEWRLIKTAMDTAFDKKFGEVFVWAGTQVRRDNKYIGYDGYEAVSLLLNQQEILNSIYEYLTKLVVHGGYDDSEIRELIDTKEDTSNKISSWNSTPDDTHFPTEKLVKTGLEGKSDTGHTHTKSDITDFTHTHTKSQITDFSHTHTKRDITDFSHTHIKSEITDFAHNHDDRYYTEAEVDAIINQLKEELLTRFTLTGDKSIIQSGDTVNLVAQHIDDGVSVYNEDIYFFASSTILYNKVSEQTISIQDEETKTADNVCFVGLDDFELSFDLYANGSAVFGLGNCIDGTGYLGDEDYIALGNYACFIQMNNVYEDGESWSSLNNAYHSYKISKSGGVVNLYLDGTLKKTISFDSFVDTVYYLRVLSNGATSVKLKNIKLKVL